MKVFTKSILIMFFSIFFICSIYAESTKLKIVRSEGNYPPNEFKNQEGKLI